MSGVSLSGELQVMHQVMGLSLAQIRQTLRAAAAASFLPARSGPRRWPPSVRAERQTLSAPESATRRRARCGSASSQRAPDQDLLHLGRALVDLAHAHVAVDALHREVADVAVAAEHLDRRAAHALRPSRWRRAWPSPLPSGTGWPASFRLAAWWINWRAASMLRGHVGQLELHRLVVEDRLAEGHALLAVGQRRVEGGARHAHALRRDADAPALQAPTARSSAPCLLRPAGWRPARGSCSNRICAVSLACWPILSSMRATV